VKANEPGVRRCDLRLAAAGGLAVSTGRTGRTAFTGAGRALVVGQEG